MNVEVLRAAMGHRRQKLAVSDLIAGQLIGDNHPRHAAGAFDEQSHRGRVDARVNVQPGHRLHLLVSYAQPFALVPKSS